MLDAERRDIGTPLGSAEVARRLISLLLQGGYRPGDRLPAERQLGHDLGVGRSVVREALRSLSLLGIVSMRPGAGTYLSAMADEPVPKASELGLLLSNRRVADLVTVSVQLEAVVAGFAAERRSDTAMADLDQLRGAVVSDRTPLATIEAERRFHAVVSGAATNHVLAEIVASIRALLDAPLAQAMDERADRRWVNDDHRQVTEAIRYRDAEMARTAMSAHMRRLARVLRVPVDEPGVGVAARSEALEDPVHDLQRPVHVGASQRA